MYKIKELIQILTENRWLVCRILFAVYLIGLSVMDLRVRRLKFSFLMAGFLFAVAGELCGRDIPVLLLAAGAAVGGIFLVVSRLTGEAFGYGDSILITVMGSFIGFWNILSLLIAAFLMAAAFSVFLLAGKRFGRKDSFPFVPFLTAAYIVGMAAGIY